MNAQVDVGIGFGGGPRAAALDRRRCGRVRGLLYAVTVGSDLDSYFVK
jgi:hypothetical protein